uniref:Uncharacterized protein n=1 Tax=Anguilla anguilla TaxID=7936 RepID=A0A0E9RT45_ANGAN
MCSPLTHVTLASASLQTTLREWSQQRRVRRKHTSGACQLAGGQCSIMGKELVL